MSDYFGEPWPSGICDEGRQVPTPVGFDCLLCGEAIQEGDRGSFLGTPGGYRPVHRECNLRQVTGGIEHLTAGPHKIGSCYEGTTLTYRQSSLQAWDWVREHGVTGGT